MISSKSMYVLEVAQRESCGELVTHCAEDERLPLIMMYSATDSRNFHA
jgi:hypothetical protein